MTYMEISATASIEVLNYRGLREAWRIYGGPGSLVGRFAVRTPLTSAQLRRLPTNLRTRLVEGKA